jgi:hypothetical protein
MGCESPKISPLSFGICHDDVGRSSQLIDYQFGLENSDILPQNLATPQMPWENHWKGVFQLISSIWVQI